MKEVTTGAYLRSDCLDATIDLRQENECFWTKHRPNQGTIYFTLFLSSAFSATAPAWPPQHERCWAGHIPDKRAASHGAIVNAPSGCLPSDVQRPVGSSVEGIFAADADLSVARMLPLTLHTAEAMGARRVNKGPTKAALVGDGKGEHPAAGGLRTTILMTSLGPGGNAWVGHSARHLSGHCQEAREHETWGWIIR